MTIIQQLDGRVPLTALTLGLLAGTAWSQQDRPPSRETVAGWFKHQEGVVQSCECRFKVVQKPTDAEKVARIRREVTRERLPPGMLPYWSPEAAENQVNSYVCKWWRKGVMERYEKYNLSDDLDTTTFWRAVAFDGQIVRTFAPAEAASTPAGAVQTIENSSWFETIRHNPFSMIFEHYNLPWSEVVLQATEFKATTEARPDATFTRVVLKHPKGNLNCVLVLDQEHRLIERHRYRRPLLAGSKLDPDIGEQDTFVDYKAYPLPGGERVWFPSQATYIGGFLGRAKDGTLLGGTPVEITILDIRFNANIPDETFALHIPKDAEVMDGVSGMGILKPGVRPASLFPEEARRRRLWLFAILVLCVLVLTGAASAWSRRRRRRLQNG